MSTVCVSGVGEYTIVRVLSECSSCDREYMWVEGESVYTGKCPKCESAVECESCWGTGEYVGYCCDVFDRVELAVYSDCHVCAGTGEVRV